MQDRLTYASGNTITTEGFRCSVGEPIDIKVTVGEDEEVALSTAAGKSIPNGDHLITLEVNGEKVAYRDLYHLGEDTVTVGDYTISDDLYLTGVSEDDEVVMRLEPVELTVTDEFRAAVKNVAPTGGSGGGSGGGVLVVHRTESGTKSTNLRTPGFDTSYVLDKTWKEIHDAGFAVLSVAEEDGTDVFTFLYPLNLVSVTSEDGYLVRFTAPDGNIFATTDSENGYPVMQ